MRDSIKTWIITATFATMPLNINGNYPTFELDGESGEGFGVFGVLVDIIEL